MPPGREIISGHLALLCNSAISQARLIHVTNVTAGKTQRTHQCSFPSISNLVKKFVAMLSNDCQHRPMHFRWLCLATAVEVGSYQRVAAPCMGALGRWDEYMNSSAGFGIMHIWAGDQISKRMSLSSHDELSRTQTRSPMVYARMSVAADSRLS
jgi:hypothetical protein